jgi:hypothetical protein
MSSMFDSGSFKNEMARPNIRGAGDSRSVFDTASKN